MARIMCDRCSGYDSEHDAMCPNLIGLESTTEVADGGRTVFITQRWPREADPKVFEARENAIMEGLGGQYAVIARQRTDDPVSKTVRQQTQFVRYAKPPLKEFVSPEAAAYATVETLTCDDPKCGCREYDEKGRPKTVHFMAPVENIRVDYSDLSAMQPVRTRAAILEDVKTCDACVKPGRGSGENWAITCDKHRAELSALDRNSETVNPPAASNPLPIPQTVTASTGMDADGNPANPFVFKPQMIQRGAAKIGGLEYPEGAYIPFIDIVQQMNRRVSDPVIASEEIHVKWQKRDDLDAAMTKECRAALAKLREWPRCKDHDAPMALKCCLPFSGNGKRYAFAGCTEIGCRRTSAPVEVELTGPTARAIGDESWTAPEYRT